ncbi:MFS transporter [Pseudoalteromonas luteoviolacea]|uniref:MFS transporter n=1 Tax=Pseudoalteromonas luteoviolacea TaxID=43657 RepID=A0A0C1QCE7_9GAMM|nr:MFS transporter [Pseudoalteromonas luteoviolacea]KID58301.1 MFS transporter [Pseudoalteromonas luteoviolacea]
MELTQFSSQIGRFTPLVWVMLLGNFFVRASYYMVWPFLAVMLYSKYGLSATEVGVLLTGSAVFAVLLGFYTGNLADRFGRFALLYTAAVVGVLAFAALALAEQLWAFCLAVFFACMPRTLWDAPSKALLSDELSNSEDRELALHLLYFLVNVGAAIGPLFGLWAGLNGEQFSFIYTAFAYLGLLLALILKQSSAAKNDKNAQQVQVPSFKSWLAILRQDTRFLWVLLATFLVYMVYGQGDSSLVQYLTRAQVPELAVLISSLIITNSLVIVIFQFPLLHVMRNWSIQSRLYFGGGILVLSQVMMAINPVEGFWGWIGAIAVLSFSEAIMFSNINIYIDRMAPSHLKASYFGAAGLCSLGFAFAPLVGGVLLDWGSGAVLFIAMAIASLKALYLYKLAESASD